MTADSSTVLSGRLQKELQQNRPFANLQAEAFLNLVRTTSQLQHMLRLHLKPHSITETQYNSLRILRGAGEAGLTCSEIADRLVSRDPDITRLMGRLERMELVHRERHTKDRRIVVARITRKGLERLEELDQVVASGVTKSLIHLTEQELRALITLLERVRNAVAD